MTVRENIAFPLKLARLDRREIDRRVERAAAALELGALLERKPASLSGGQRQRVAMGRAIVREPDAFLLDEPLSNLDAKLRVQMRAEIARTHKRLGTTTVYVTHDQTEAMTLGQRVAVLRKGEVQQIGTPRELYERPANLFVAGFIGSPAMNFLPARIDGERLRLPMAELELPRAVRERLPGTEAGLIAGIRPEHLRETAGTGTPGPTFSATVDVLEWLGADVYAYFAIEGASAADLRALPEELDIEPAKDGRLPLVARLEAGSLAAEGAALELALDPSRIHLFSARSGARLSS
jgi:multiple sugar transport system ATP-binding protein